MDVAVSLSSRREFFARSLGFAGLLGVPGAMSLGNSVRAAGQRPNTSLILLWQDGGPSPFETFDPKPAAPLEYRGELGVIQTSLVGVQFCEVLPRLAKLADRLCIVRSLHQPVTDRVDPVLPHSW